MRRQVKKGKTMPQLDVTIRNRAQEPFLVAIVGFDSSCRKMTTSLLKHTHLELTYFLGAEAVRAMDVSVSTPDESPLARFACVVVVEHEQHSGETKSWNVKLHTAVAKITRHFNLVFLALCATEESRALAMEVATCAAPQH